MKNRQYILVVSLFLLLATACSDYLDVKPENQLVKEDFWKKGSDVEAVVKACYRSMQESDFMQRVSVWGELRSDNVLTNTSSGAALKEIDNVNILSTNEYSDWRSFYEVINLCNTVIKYAPEVMEKDLNFRVPDLHAKQAEVKAIRALCYFYLVRTFRDVPLSLDATISDGQDLMIKQVTPDSVLNVITRDLLEAEQWALDVYPTTYETKGRMTKDAIRALLADIYLWRQDYANCVIYCDKLINASIDQFDFSGNVVKVPKYKLILADAANSIFSNGAYSRGRYGAGCSSESIFELQFSHDVLNSGIYSPNDKKGLYGDQISATSGYADPATSTVFPKTDTRRTSYIEYPKTDKGIYGIWKYKGVHYSLGLSDQYASHSLSNWIFYRITDVMLMKAEALTQLKGEANLRKALELVNTTYMRSNASLAISDTLAYSQYNNEDAMDKLVLLERQRELMFEGKRWFDLVRHSERRGSTTDLVSYVLNKYSANLSTIAIKLAVMNSLYLPIFQDELVANPNLVQNPYYQESSTIVK